MSGPIVLEDHGTHALLRIERADKRNAMNSFARAALRQCLAQLQGGPKAIILTGIADCFCSGMDLKEHADVPDALIRRKEANQEWIETLLDIRRHPAIVIAAVNGIALGGGTSLINVADLAIAADEAEIGMPEMGFGMYPAMAGPATQLMLGPKRAAWMVLTARRIDGQTAERWGLVNQSVPRMELAATAEALAVHIAQFDAIALAESKRAMDTVPRRISEWPEAFEFGQAVNVGIRARSKSQEEGLARFAAGGVNPGQGMKR